MPVEIDLLPLANATVTAPAGCGKTELIADALRRHSGPKPILVLTHTNAGVAALRGRLDRACVPSSAYRLSTIDGWAIRLALTFPKRSALDPAAIESASPNYPAIRVAAKHLLAGGHIQDILGASYAKIIVDEYQDCAVPQHEMICHAAETLPTVLLGDPLQAIFNWRGNEPPDWDGDVCRRFPVVGELQTPWRWINANTEGFGRWLLLDMRKELTTGRCVDLGTAPGELDWIRLDGTDDETKRRVAARIRPSDADAKVIILGDNRPATHRRIASQTPGAITVEAVDLRDLVDFAKSLNFSTPDAALRQILEFAGSLMTNVASAEVLARVATLTRGKGRTEPSDVEREALAFRSGPSPSGAASLLSAITASPGVRLIFNTCAAPARLTH